MGSLTIQDLRNNGWIAYEYVRGSHAYGLNTVEKIAPKYCEGNTWAGMINWYIKQIKKS